jgi:prephenate dehydrogenase
MVGYEAAQTVTLHSFIRAVTELEKKVIATHKEQEHRYQAFAHPTRSLRQPKPQGLHVWDEIHDDIMAILQHVKFATTTPKYYQVFQLRSLLPRDDGMISSNNVTHQSKTFNSTSNQDQFYQYKQQLDL